MQSLGLIGEMESIQNTQDCLKYIVPTDKIAPSGERKRKEHTMEARLNAQQASPAAYAALVDLETFVRKASKLEHCLSNS